jgi:hypothetical protein
MEGKHKADRSAVASRVAAPLYCRSALRASQGSREPDERRRLRRRGGLSYGFVEVAPIATPMTSRPPLATPPVRRTRRPRRRTRSMTGRASWMPPRRWLPMRRGCATRPPTPAPTRWGRLPRGDPEQALVAEGDRLRRRPLGRHRRRLQGDRGGPGHRRNDHRRPAGLSRPRRSAHRPRRHRSQIRPGKSLAMGCGLHGCQLVFIQCNRWACYQQRCVRGPASTTVGGRAAPLVSSL